MSAVVLIYSCIDSLAALTRPKNQKDTNRKFFKKWVDDYLRPDLPKTISAEDLYAARCGILHTYSQDSSLRREGKAKAIIYFWKNGPNPNAEISLPSDAIVIAIEDLLQCLDEGIVRFLLAVDTDDELKKKR
jgi:hypothetical protein